jgi:nucleotide-binding universal stress UspA family protein
MQESNRSIVVGVDFGPGGDKAILEGVTRVAEGRATQLHAVHVLDPSNPSDPLVVPALISEALFLEHGPCAIRERVEEIARSEALPLSPEALQVYARIGNTADTLLQVVAECDAELIVVGSHAQPRLERLLGSVSALLVRTAACTVLIARSEGHSMLLLKTERPALPFGAGQELCSSVLCALPAVERRDVDA